MQESVRQGDEVKKNSIPSSVTRKFPSSSRINKDTLSSLFSTTENSPSPIASTHYSRLCISTMYKSHIRGSNPRPLVYKTNALPLS
jgi:hypothetical protein